MKFVWLLLEIFTFHLNSLDSVVLAHPFWALSIFLVCSSALSSWTNRTSSKPPSSTFLHSCWGSWLFATDVPRSHGPEYVDVSTVSPLSYVWSYHYFSQRKQIQMSSMIFLSCQLGYFSTHSTYAFTQTISIKQRSSFKCQRHFVLLQVHSLTSLSWTSKPTFSDIILHDDFRFAIFFLTYASVVMMLWWEEDDNLISCWYMRYQC